MKRDGQVFVLLDGGLEPLFAVSGEMVMGEEGDGEGDVWLGWGKVAVFESLVDNVKSSAASGFFQVGCHASDGVDFQVSVCAAAQLFGGFKGGSSVFGEVAKKGEGVQTGGSEKMWFVDGMLPPA